MIWPVLVAYLVAAWLDGVRGVVLLAAIGLAGCTVMFGAEWLMLCRRARAERATVYRRWAAWEFQDWLRRHSGWRS